MNINLLANNAVTSITPNQTVEWFQFESVTNTGVEPVVTYKAPISVAVMVQIADPEVLQYIENYASTKIYKNFWFNSQVSGLNWPQQLLQDYLVYENLRYYITKVVHIYEDWVNVIGCASTEGV